MINKNFFVSEFSFKKIDNHLLISTAKGVCHVAIELDVIFNYLKKFIGEFIDYESFLNSELSTTLNISRNDIEKIINLLIEIKIIYECHAHNNKYEIQVYSELTNYNALKLKEEINFNINPEIIAKFHSYNIDIIFIEEYPDKIIYDSNKIEPNRLFFSSYFYKNYFIIDAPYIPSLGFPCHYCNLLNLLQENKKINSDIAQSRIPATQINKFRCNINDAYRYAAIFHFTKRISEILLDENCGKSQLVTTYLDLNTGNLKFENPIHNPMCSCLLT